MEKGIGLQLHTVREFADNDFLGTLEKVSKVGYRGIEMGARVPLPLNQLKKELERLRLQVIAVHTLREALEQNLDGVIQVSNTLGSRYIVISWWQCESIEAIEEIAPFFNHVGERCRKEGIQFCYHNHDHEFKIMDGRYALDILLEKTNPEFFKLELDTYWAKFGGAHPLEYLKSHAGRCPLLHIKDMAADESRTFTEVGTGCMDFPGIVSAAPEAGVEWLVVEQDECKRNPFDSITISYENLRKLVTP